MPQIKRIGIKQTTKFVFVFYFVISFVIFLPIFLISMLVGGASDTEGMGMFGAVFGGIFMIFLPFIYAIMGAVMFAISALLYNLIAKYVGGIEVEIDGQEKKKVEQPTVTPPNPNPPTK